MRVCTRKIYSLILVISLQSLLTVLTLMDTLSSNMSASWKTPPTASLFVHGLRRYQLRISLSNCRPLWAKGTPNTCGQVFSTETPLLRITMPRWRWAVLPVYLHGCHGICRWRHICCGKAKMSEESVDRLFLVPRTVARVWIGVWWPSSTECHDYKRCPSQANWFWLGWRGRPG